MKNTEKITLELRKKGRLSWDRVERCAQEANMCVNDWIFDAIATKMRRQDRESYEAQRRLWQPTPQEEPPIHPFREKLGNTLQKFADRLWDSIDADIAKARSKEGAK